MLNVSIKGIKRLERTLKVEGRRQKKAMDTAVKVEAFRLMRLLKSEIRKGAPGGRQFSPLSHILRRRGRNSPLRRLAIAVRYYVAERDPLSIHVGWVGPRVSSRWKYIAKVQQAGFVTDISEAMRAHIIRSGARLGKRSKMRRFHFLRRSTKQFKTPARPIMVPFWAAHRSEARRRISRNFQRKMRGERI